MLFMRPELRRLAISRLIVERLTCSHRSWITCRSLTFHGVFHLVITPGGAGESGRGAGESGQRLGGAGESGRGVGESGQRLGGAGELGWGDVLICQLGLARTSAILWGRKALSISAVRRGCGDMV